MVQFVLEHSCEQPAALGGEGGAVQQLSLEDDPGRALHIGIKFRYAEAAFIEIGKIVRVRYNLRIDERHGHFREQFHLAGRGRRERFTVFVLFRTDINDHDLEGQSHLISGEPDPVLFIHQFQHVGSQRADIVCDLFHGLCFRRKDRIAEVTDTQFFTFTKHGSFPYARGFFSNAVRIRFAVSVVPRISTVSYMPAPTVVPVAATRRG